MRKNFGAKPWTYPQPVYIVGTYDENGKPDAMNAAWGCISDMAEISLSLSASHKTVANLKKTGAFTVSIADRKNLTACDYVGIVSGNDEPGKFEKAGFHAVPSSRVNAPVIRELPMCLECRVTSYDDKNEVLKGEIVNVSADESVLTDGKIDPRKLDPLIFDPVNALYWTFGEKAGNAFSDGNSLK